MTISMKANGDHYDILKAIVNGDTTSFEVVGTAQRDRVKPRFFNFNPSLVGAELGLLPGTYDRMKDSPAGEGLLTSVATVIALTLEPAHVVRPAPTLVKVNKPLTTEELSVEAAVLSSASLVDLANRPVVDFAASTEREPTTFPDLDDTGEGATPIVPEGWTPSNEVEFKSADVNDALNQGQSLAEATKTAIGKNKLRKIA